MLSVIDEDLDLSDDEMLVYSALEKNMSRSISEIMNNRDIAFGKSKVTKLLKSLVQNGIVIIEGAGRGTRYRINPD